MPFLVDELRAFIERKIEQEEKRNESSHKSTYHSSTGALSAYNQVLVKLKDLEEELYANQG